MMTLEHPLDDESRAFPRYSRDLPIERYLPDATLCTIVKEAKPLILAHREPRNPNA